MLFASRSFFYTGYCADVTDHSKYFVKNISYVEQLIFRDLVRRVRISLFVQRVFVVVPTVPREGR